MKMRKSTSKILSLVLVLSFVFSLSAVTASAADTNEQYHCYKQWKIPLGI